MNAHDVIDAIFTLDDRHRELTSELEASVALLEARLGRLSALRPGQVDLGALRRQVEFGCAEPPELRVAMELLRDGLIATALSEMSWPARGPGSSGDDHTARLATASRKLGVVVDELRPILELAGRLAYLLERRAAIEVEQRAAHERLAEDELMSETLALLLELRQSSGSCSAVSARVLLAEVESQAAQDPTLVALNESAVQARESLAQARGSMTPDASTTAPAGFIEGAAALAAHLARERADARQRLDRLALDAERRGEGRRSRAHLATRAAEVGALAEDLERRLADGVLPRGALGPLKAACLEHAALTLLMGFRDIGADSERLAALAKEIAERLGAILEHPATPRDHKETLARVFDELAVADASVLENEWEQTFSMVMGMWRDAGVPAVKAKRLEELLAADSFEAWGRRLHARIAAKQAAADRMADRVRGARALLREIAASTEATRETAARADEILDEFIHARTAVEREYYETVKARLDDPALGLALLDLRTAPFVHCDGLGVDASGSERHAAHAATLAGVRALFAPLAEETPAASSDALQDARSTAEAAACQRELVQHVARLRRLRQVLLPGGDAACRAAVALGRRLQSERAGTAHHVMPGASAADMLGDHLEALDVEQGYLEMLDAIQSHGGEAALPPQVVRDQRLLDLQGASLTLLLALVRIAADEAKDQDAAAAEWVSQLLARADADLARYLARFERCLLDLADADDRSERFHVALHACLSLRSGEAPTHPEWDAACQAFELRLSDVAAPTLSRLKGADAGIGTMVALDNLVDFLGRALTAVEGTDLEDALREALAERRDRAAAIRAEACDPDREESGVDSEAVFA